MKVALALGPVRLPTGAYDCRESQRRDDGNNDYNRQQLDKSEAEPAPALEEVSQCFVSPCCHRGLVRATSALQKGRQESVLIVRFPCLRASKEGWQSGSWGRCSGVLQRSEFSKGRSRPGAGYSTDVTCYECSLDRLETQPPVATVFVEAACLAALNSEQ